MSGSFEEMMAELERGRPKQADKSVIPPTPGPWTTAHHHGDFLKLVAPADTDFVFVGRSSLTPQKRLERDANAALICAAPEMLAMLKAMSEITFGSPVITLDDVRRIINKAEGRIP